MVKLVTIGDSLTQGFQSLAINKTDLSYPAMIAESLGVPVPDFRVPDFKRKGGLPFNLEWLARRLEEKYGHSINLFEWAFAVDTIIDLLDDVEDCYERGKGAQPQKDVNYHNLAVWGFEVADAFKMTAKICKTKIKNTKEDWFCPPSEPRMRTAYRVLNPAQLASRDTDTQIKIAQKIAQENGPIENLIVWLGANNCLGTVVRLKIVETGTNPPPPNSEFNLWSPAAFKKDYAKLSAEIKKINATNIYVGTVPHVTIPPVSRGIMKNRGRLPQSRTYYDYYTHFFIHDKKFDEERDPHLTREEAKKIDDYINEYNKTIKGHADQNGWHVVDTCDVLDRLAARRNHGQPTYPLPPELQDLSVRFFEIENNGSIKNGGLIALDGVHPTTCGYAIVAKEFISVMRSQNPTIRDIDFAQVRSEDSLVSRPPLTLDDMFGMLRTVEKVFHVSRILASKD